MIITEKNVCFYTPFVTLLVPKYFFLYEAKLFSRKLFFFYQNSWQSSKKILRDFSLREGVAVQFRRKVEQKTLVNFFCLVVIFL